jgi:hypothetical protein
MSFVFNSVERETKVLNYIQIIINKLKALAGLLDDVPIMQSDDPNMV